MRKDTKSPYPNLIKKILEQATDNELRLIYVFARELTNKGGEQSGSNGKNRKP